MFLITGVRSRSQIQRRPILSKKSKYLKPGTGVKIVVPLCCPFVKFLRASTVSDKHGIVHVTQKSSMHVIHFVSEIGEYFF